jgi:phosphatidylethanolamine/phosphatidyl-N-methylethanolamine N-methyltransferase
MTTDQASVASAYDRYAGIYDRLFGWVLQDGRERLVKAMRIAAQERIVEFGVGSGLMLPLYPRHASVLGLDLSEGMLEQARQRIQRLGLTHVELRHIDAEHNGLPPAAFDHVVLPYVYSVTPDPDALVREAFRVCVPGGSIWILNHFSGLGFWDWLEGPLRPVARWVGFRPDFPFKTWVSDQPWRVEAVQRANLLGLSRIVHVRKPG